MSWANSMGPAYKLPKKIQQPTKHEPQLTITANDSAGVGEVMPMKTLNQPLSTCVVHAAAEKFSAVVKLK